MSAISVVPEPSIHPDTGELHDLRPFLSFTGDVACECDWRHRIDDDAQFTQPPLELRIGKPSCNRIVERIDDIGRRTFRREQNVPAADVEQRGQPGAAKPAQQDTQGFESTNANGGREPPRERAGG